MGRGGYLPLCGSQVCNVRAAYIHHWTWHLAGDITPSPCSFLPYVSTLPQTTLTPLLTGTWGWGPGVVWCGDSLLDSGESIKSWVRALSPHLLLD